MIPDAVRRWSRFCVSPFQQEIDSSVDLFLELESPQVGAGTVPRTAPHHDICNQSFSSGTSSNFSSFLFLAVSAVARGWLFCEQHECARPAFSALCNPIQGKTLILLLLNSIRRRRKTGTFFVTSIGSLILKRGRRQSPPT